MKQNYRQAKRQKELARKARQQEKQQRRGTKVEGEGEPAPEAAVGTDLPQGESPAVGPAGPAGGTGAT